MNSVGTYVCDCPDGWTHNSGNQASDGCIHDVDECQENVDICKKNENVDGSGNPTDGRIFAVCQNSVGSYECNCQSGYWFTHDWGSQTFLVSFSKIS